MFKFFAKETFETIDLELDQVFLALGLSKSKLKIRKQTATYSKPYDYVVEGQLEGHRFVLSLHSSPLKERETKQQLELIIQCENPNWIAFELRQKEQAASQKKNLGMEVIRSLEVLNINDLVLECNERAFVEMVFDLPFCKQLIRLNELSFSTFKVERKRLYYKTTWLPNEANKSRLLMEAIRLGISLVQAIDQ